MFHLPREAGIQEHHRNLENLDHKKMCGKMHCERIMIHYPSLFRHWISIFIKYGHRPPRRYREILTYIATHDVRSILEIGVYTGARAMEMICAARIHHPASSIEYIGFDVFEEMTPELCQKEFSKMPLSQETIRTYLTQSKASIDLRKGYSQETIPTFTAQRKKPIDFIFIDGGHAIETITSDWNNIQKLMQPNTMVVFDDYYTSPPETVMGIGCQTLIDTLDRKVYNVRIGTISDSFTKPWGMLTIKLAFVSLVRT